MSSYDSRSETLKHILQVRRYLEDLILALYGRKRDHDLSKLNPPEKEVIDRMTSRLKDLEYGSKEYAEALDEMRPALEHHYHHNRHHPEHHEAGVRGMNLVDLCEMIADWKAATLRHDNGDIFKSIEINQQRFGYGDELKQILQNTIRDLGWGK